MYKTVEKIGREKLVNTLEISNMLQNMKDQVEGKKITVKQNLSNTKIKYTDLMNKQQLENMYTFHETFT